MPAGIEVILDVVFNHTAEGNEGGPLLGLKGFDNPVYYRLMPDKRYYDNVTGCGNTVNCAHPQVRELVVDCLRYWVQEMHVDGFRFDLATVLAREDGGFNPHSPFFKAVRAERALERVKLIAEPWDVGWGGYQLGRFPPGWAEWNDRFRDTVRAFWRARLRQDRGAGRTVRRIERCLPPQRPQTHGHDQLRHRARRIHPRRSGLIQRAPQPRKSRTQCRRHRQQSQLELRRRGPDHRCGRRGTAAAADEEPADHPDPRPGSAHAAGGR